MGAGDPGEWFVLGEITSPQGLKGEVRVKVLAGDPDRLARMDAVYVKPTNQPARRRRIRSARQHGRVWIVQLDGVGDREQAEPLRGATLCLRRAELEPLPEGSYYVFQLMGLHVYTTEGSELGVIADVLSTGANDVYVVERPAGGELLLPAIRECVRAVDLTQGKMVVYMMPGLDDL